MSKHNTLIFDLDGTLIHSAPDIHVAINTALTSQRLRSLSLQEVISFIGNGVEKLVERSLRHTGGKPEQQSDTLVQFLHSYKANGTALTRPYPGVIACLERLRDSGKRLGICTNKPTGAARDICDALALTPYFDVIEGADPARPRKPDAAPLLHVIERLNASPIDALYIGDSTVDHRTAQNAGVAFRLFSSGYLNAALPDVSQADQFGSWDAPGF